MVHFKASVLATFLGLAQVNAHFLLNYPTTVGFDDDNEGNAPCGGFSVSFDKSTDFFVGGDAIALTSTHPAAVWLFRATLDQTAAGNWSNLLPAVSQDALGNFCETGINVPSDFAGQKGVIQVVQSAVDGLLYQCAAVNFKAGSNPSTPSACKNATGVTAVFTSDSALSTIPGGSSASGTAGSSASGTAGSSSPTSTGAGASQSTGTATGSAASTSPTHNSAVREYVGNSIFWGSLLAIGALTLGL